MKASVYTRYGGPEVLQILDVPRPTPKPDEVLVRVHATTVNRSDCGLRSASPFIVRAFTGLLRPRRQVLGSEFSGFVEEIGAAVRGFAVGDRVFGVNADRMGAHAEYLCVPEGGPIAQAPESLPLDQAAAVCDGAILALGYLRKIDVAKRPRLMVYGASGAIGTAAVQLARHEGFHVTAVCNTRNVDVVRTLRPDVVIDYEKEDFRAAGPVYDSIFDAVGKRTFGYCRPVLSPEGIYLATDLGPGWQNPPLVLWTAQFGRQKVLLPLPRYTKADVEFLRELVDRGEFRPVIDRCYPLDDIVEATRYVETEQKTGNVVVAVRPV